MVELTPDRKLNIQKLEKGDFIAEEVLRVATGYDANENPEIYRFAVLALREQLKKERRFHARGEGRALRILTENEASYYKSNLFQIRQRGQQRDYEDLVALDEEEMDAVTRQQHRRRVEESSRFISAQQGISKQIRSEQAQERVARANQEQPVTIVTTKSTEGSNGTTTDQRHHQGHRAPDLSQRMGSESAQPNS